MTDWHVLYVDNARVYQPVLEAGLASAPAEAKGLDKVFRRFGPNHVGRRPKILDLSCGIGRHSISLAKLGYEVVGFDFSPYFLKTAQRLANREGLRRDSVRFIEGDANRLREILGERGEAGFDAVVCMDTSIVRSTLEEERRLVLSMRDVSRPGAILVVETASRDAFLRHKASLPFVQTFDGGKLQRHISAAYDSRMKHIKGCWRFYRVERNDDLKHLLTFNWESNIHSESDLRKLLKESGWTHLRTYGGIRKLDKLTSDSFHIVMVTKRVS